MFFSRNANGTDILGGGRGNGPLPEIKVFSPTNSAHVLPLVSSSQQVNTHLNTSYWVDKAEDYIDPPPSPPYTPPSREYSLEDATVDKQKIVSVKIWLFILSICLFFIKIHLASTRRQNLSLIHI